MGEAGGGAWRTLLTVVVLRSSWGGTRDKRVGSRSPAVKPWPADLRTRMTGDSAHPYPAFQEDPVCETEGRVIEIVREFALFHDHAGPDRPRSRRSPAKLWQAISDLAVLHETDSPDLSRG